MAAENPTWGEERIANELHLIPQHKVAELTLDGRLARRSAPGNLAAFTILKVPTWNASPPEIDDLMGEIWIWTADGREILFAGSAGSGNSSLWRVARDVPTPPATGTHVPIPHIAVVDG